MINTAPEPASFGNARFNLKVMTNVGLAMADGP